MTARYRALAPALLLVGGCLPGPRDVAIEAIEAVAEDDPAALAETLDDATRSLFEAAWRDREALPSPWHWHHGRPERLLAGAEVEGTEELTDDVAIVRLRDSPLREVVALREAGIVLPRWRLHLAGSDALWDELRMP